VVRARQERSSQKQASPRRCLLRTLDPQTTITKPPDVKSTTAPGIRSIWILLAPTSSRAPPNTKCAADRPGFSFPPPLLPVLHSAPPALARNDTRTVCTVDGEQAPAWALSPRESPRSPSTTAHVLGHLPRTCTHLNSNHRLRATRCLPTTSTTTRRRPCPPAPVQATTLRATRPSSPRHPPERAPRSRATATRDAPRTLCRLSTRTALRAEPLMTADFPLHARTRRREAPQAPRPNM
jgi:hypothetical protein